MTHPSAITHILFSALSTPDPRDMVNCSDWPDDEPIRGLKRRIAVKPGLPPVANTAPDD